MGIVCGNLLWEVSAWISVGIYVKILWVCLRAVLWAFRYEFLEMSLGVSVGMSVGVSVGFVVGVSVRFCGGVSVGVVVGVSGGVAVGVSVGIVARFV